jgi:hypothetical protein
VKLIKIEELGAAISSITPQFGKLYAKKQAHPSHYITHVKPEVHEPLQDITLLVSNMKLSCMLNMLHLITNIADLLQPRKLCSRNQNSDSDLFFIAAQKFREKMNEMSLKC